MRFRKLVAAALMAVVAYTAATVVAASTHNSHSPLASVVTGGVAYADIASDQCENSKYPDACAVGYRGELDNKKRIDVCQPYSGEEKSACEEGYDAAVTGIKVQGPGPSGSGAPSGGTSGSSDGEKCDQGNMTWMACPLIDGISSFITGMAKDLLTQFLSVQPLTFSGPIYDTWNSMRALSNVAFVLIFLVMIFATTTRLNISAYSVRKILPRLVLAALLVQASYLISALIVDLGNIMGAGVGSLISSVTNSGTTAGLTSGRWAENLITGLGLGVIVGLGLMAWPFAVSAGLMLLISLLGAIAVITARYFLIGILTVLSPLAFIAWILPGTEQYYHKWQKAFIRLILMYPIIILILSIAGNVPALIPNMAQPDSSLGQTGQSIATSVVKIMVLIAGFAAIPQTFKWAGGFMEMAYTQLNDVRGKGVKAVRDSQRYEEAKDKTRLRSAARGDKIDKALHKMIKGEGKFARGTRGALLDAGGLILAARGSTSSRAREMDAAAIINKKTKQIGEMRGGNDMMNWRRAMLYHYGDSSQRDKAFTELRAQGAEAILDHTGDLEGRQAIMRKLADNNLAGPEVANAVKAWTEQNPSKRRDDFRMFQLENGKNMPKSPALFARSDAIPAAGSTNFVGQAAQIGDINDKMAAGFLSSLTPDAIKSNDSWKLDNYKLASNFKATNSDATNRLSEQWTNAMYKAIPREAFVMTFDHTDRRNFKGSDKRGETLIAFARHHDMFTNPANPGYTTELNEIYNAVVGQVSTNAAHHQDALRYVVREQETTEDLLTVLGLPHP